MRRIADAGGPQMQIESQRRIEAEVAEEGLPKWVIEPSAKRTRCGHESDSE